MFGLAGQSLAGHEAQRPQHKTEASERESARRAPAKHRGPGPQKSIGPQQTT